MNLKKIYEKINQDQVLTATVAAIVSTTILGALGAITGKINKQTILSVVEFIKSILTYKVPIIHIIGTNLIVSIILIMYFKNKKKNILENEIEDNQSSGIDIEVNANTTIDDNENMKESSYIDCPKCSVKLSVKPNSKTNIGTAMCNFCNIQIQVETANDKNIIKNIKDIKNNNSSDGLYLMDVGESKDVIINGNVLDSKVLNYTEDTFEGIKFKWNYNVSDSGYKIVKLQGICPICKNHLTYEEITYYSEDGVQVNKALTCYNCYYQDDDSVNNDAQLVYEEKEYELLMKFIKSRIVTKALMLKNTPNDDNEQKKFCKEFKDYLINEFNLFTYEDVQFKLNYKIESNKVLIDNIEPICSNCSCDLYVLNEYLGHPDDGIDIIKLICPECECCELEFSYTEYDKLIEKCNCVLKHKLEYKEKEYAINAS